MKNLLLNNNKWDSYDDDILVERVDLFSKVHILIGDSNYQSIYESKHSYAELYNLLKVKQPMSWGDIVKDKEFASEFNQIGIIEMYGQG